MMTRQMIVSSRHCSLRSGQRLSVSLDSRPKWTEVFGRSDWDVYMCLNLMPLAKLSSLLFFKFPYYVKPFKPLEQRLLPIFYPIYSMSTIICVSIPQNCLVILFIFKLLHCTCWNLWYQVFTVLRGWYVYWNFWQQLISIVTHTDIYIYIPIYLLLA